MSHKAYLQSSQVTRIYFGIPKEIGIFFRYSISFHKRRIAFHKKAYLQSSQLTRHFPGRILETTWEKLFYWSRTRSRKSLWAWNDLRDMVFRETAYLTVISRQQTLSRMCSASMKQLLSIRFFGKQRISQSFRDSRLFLERVLVCWDPNYVTKHPDHII